MRKFFLGVVMLMSLAACSSKPLPVEISTASDANQNLPIAIDLIAVSDEAATAQFAAFSGADWFQNKRAYMLQYGPYLSVNALELVPLSAATAFDWPGEASSATQYFIAANFITQPKFMPVDAHKLKAITVTKDRLDFSYRQ